MFEHHAAAIAATVGLVVSTAVHAYEALSKLGEQLGLIATLELALGLSTLGLGEDPYASSVPLEAPPVSPGTSSTASATSLSPACPKAWAPAASSGPTPNP